MKLFTLILLAFAMLATSANAQVCYDSSTVTPCPTINNGISTSAAVRSGQLILPVAALGITPTSPTKGQAATTSTGSLCLYNGTNWVNLGSVNIATGIAVGCVF